MRVIGMAGRTMTPSLRACLGSLDPEAPEDYRELAALLACEWLPAPPRIVGVSGGQGAGKSTLGRLLEAAWAAVGRRACLLALDDFYLTRAQRADRAAHVHPLFATRGPPGTHDVALCRTTLRALGEGGAIRIPIFDKGRDDRTGWRTERGPFEVVILEGWCVGALPEDGRALADPINALERTRDPEGRWRRCVNEHLATDYARVWSMLEALVFLRVPDLDAVRRWRLEQERARPAAQRMQAAAVDRFVEHFERITRSMLETLPARADCVVGLDRDHRIAEVSLRRKG